MMITKNTNATSTVLTRKQKLFRNSHKKSDLMAKASTCHIILEHYMGLFHKTGVNSKSIAGDRSRKKNIESRT